MKLLSICIPTYNRAEFLPATLESIAEQWGDDLEVTVADNGSTDGTQELVEAFQRKHEAVRYFRWPSNQGADRNYLKAVELATGRYCWILGSDDPIAKGAVGDLREILRRAEPGIILFNRLLCTKELAPIKEDRFLEVDGRRERTFDFRQPGELERYLWDARSICATFSYLSSMVFEKKEWDAVPTDEKFVGSVYVHVQKLLGICRRGALLLYLNRPLVQCRLGNDAFRDLGLAKRVLLDLHGYDLLAERCFDGDAGSARALRSVVLWEYPFGRLLRYQGVLGKDPKWPEILQLLREKYHYPSFTMALALFLGRSRALVNLSFWFRDRLQRWNAAQRIGNWTLHLFKRRRAAHP